MKKIFMLQNFDLSHLQLIQLLSLIGVLSFTILLAASTFFWNLSGIRIAECKGKSAAEEQNRTIDSLRATIRNAGSLTAQSINNTMSSIEANRLNADLFRNRPNFDIVFYQFFIQSNKLKCKPMVDLHIFNMGGRQTHDFHLFNFVVMEDYSSTCYEDASKKIGDFGSGQDKRYRFNTDEIKSNYKNRGFVVMKLKYFDKALNKEFKEVRYYKQSGTSRRLDRFLEHDQKIDDVINSYLNSKNLPTLDNL